MIDINLNLSESFRAPLLDEHRYLVLCGGAGSGKSEFAARKALYRCVVEGRHRFLVMRKIRRTLDESAVEVVRRVLAENNIVHLFNKSDLSITFAGSRGMSEVLFLGLDDPEKIKSIKGITSIWLEEATEFTKEDFLQIDLRLRDPGPLYLQVMLTFNPVEAEARWLKDMFFGPAPNPDAFVHRSTVADNPIAEVRETYSKRLEALREQDPTMYQIYGLGEWAALSGQIYQWDVRPLPTDIAFDEVWYGGDFGYSVDPAAIARIYRKADEFWLQELVYKTGLTNPMLGGEMTRAGITGNETVYFDSAEPKSIDELRRLGFNVRPAEKGPDSVRAGIDFLKSKKIHIVEGSTNLHNEVSGYCWRKNKDGDPLPEPVKFKDHCFVSGTRIATQRGQIPIECMTEADYALTRGGYRRVVASGMTRPDAQVMTAYFSDGATITGTGSHPIWANGKYIPLDTMRYGDTIEVCQTNALSIKGFRTEDIQIRSLPQTDHTIGPAGMRSAVRGICTGRFGRPRMVRYLSDITSIIGTAIRQITHSTTLNCAGLLGIARNKSSIALATLSTWLGSGRLPWLGIALETAGSGTANMPLKHTSREFLSTRSATNAALRSRASAEERQIASVPTSASQHGDGPTISTTNSERAPGAASPSPSINTSQRDSAPVYVLRVVAEKDRQPVYNLTVSDIPEFYANGVLVHNCMDAVRYGIYTHCHFAGPSIRSLAS